jgi:hypothetical protein
MNICKKTGERTQAFQVRQLASVGQALLPVTYSQLMQYHAKTMAACAVTRLSRPQTFD